MRRANSRTRDFKPGELIGSPRQRNVSSLAVSNQDKAELSRRVDKLEKEKAALVAAGGGSPAGSGSQAGAGASGGMTARQVEELERQFAAQENLLGGYQKEVERSFTELEALKAK